MRFGVYDRVYRSSSSNSGNAIRRIPAYYLGENTKKNRKVFANTQYWEEKREWIGR